MVVGGALRHFVAPYRPVGAGSNLGGRTSIISAPSLLSRQAPCLPLVANASGTLLSNFDVIRDFAPESERETDVVWSLATACEPGCDHSARSRGPSARVVNANGRAYRRW